MTFYHQGVKAGLHGTVGRIRNVIKADPEEGTHRDVYVIELGRRNTELIFLLEEKFTRIDDDEYERLMK